MPNNTLQLTWPNKELALIPSEAGRYGYRWVHPSDPRYCETHTLTVTDRVDGEQAPKEDGRAYSDRADLKPTTDNLLVLGESGDVLEALTRVPELAEKYLGKVKCVYIDPPFNTAQTFANYEDNLQHSVWLTMMRDRLEHLHALLSDDGSIWVHLDNVENHRMRVLMDEVFGPENFVAEVVWEKTRGTRNDTDISTAHDTITIYKKSSGVDFKSIRNLIPRSTAAASRYQNPDNDPRGPWRQGHTGTAKSGSEGTRFPITLPSGRVVLPPSGSFWRFSRTTFDVALSEDRVWFGKTGDSLPVIKSYLNLVAAGVVPKTWWPSEEVGSNQEAKRDHLRKMFPNEEPFATPKPERLLERIIHIATNPGDIVLDVFAGSGTTAAVAHKMGRRWVTCELIEDTMNRFTRPRLEKVVAGDDPGGITLTKGERVDATSDGLPEGLTADEAQKLTSLLNKAIRGDDALKKSADVRAIKQMVKTTKSPDTINWRGGGGFTVARLSPTCFDYDEEYDTVTLTEAATGDVLVDSVCANMNYRRTPGHPDFDGVRGRMRLAVLEGTLTAELADELISKLDDGDLLTIAATGVTDGVSAHLRTAKRGCVVTHIPGDLFQTRRVERTN